MRETAQKGEDDEDLNDLDEDEAEELIGKTPATRRRILEEKMKEKVIKLSPSSTYLTLMKGFVCTGCLYYPKSVINGGWGFQAIAMIISMVVTMYCATLLLDTRAKTGAKSYSEMGTMAYGKVGKISVDIMLILSQSGFCCAYIYFIKENFHQVLLEAFDVNFSTVWLAMISLVGFTLLCWVRKIEIFAATHVFADLMIVLTMIVILTYAGIEWNYNGDQIGTLPWINTSTYASAIGFSVYCYEGIGIIMPV